MAYVYTFIQRDRDIELTEIVSPVVLSWFVLNDCWRDSLQKDTGSFAGRRDAEPIQRSMASKQVRSSGKINRDVPGP